MTNIQKRLLRVLIVNGFTSEVNRLNYSMYYWRENESISVDTETGEIIERLLKGKHYGKETTQTRVAFLMKKYPRCWRLATQSNNAYYKRVARLKGKIKLMLKGEHVLFLTLTFNDETLDNTSIETRRKYVTRFLGALQCRYVANIDYGKEKGREHYHAVVECERVNRDDWKDYGAINWKRVNKEKDVDDTSTAIGKYLTKLVNHALKETTKNQRLLYDKVDYRQRIRHEHYSTMLTPVQDGEIDDPFIIEGITYDQETKEMLEFLGI